VLAVHHPRLELEARGGGALGDRHQVAVGDELQTHGDQRIVDLPLPLELRLLEVFLGERVFHLLEAVVVHPRGVDVQPTSFD